MNKLLTTILFAGLLSCGNSNEEEDPYKNYTYEEVMESIDTIDGVKDYIETHLNYDWEKFKDKSPDKSNDSFEKNHLDKKTICIETTYAVASLLKGDYEVINMGLDGIGINHSVALVKNNKGKYACIEMGRYYDFIFDSPQEVFNEIGKNYHSYYLFKTDGDEYIENDFKIDLEDLIHEI